MALQFSNGSLHHSYTAYSIVVRVHTVHTPTYCAGQCLKLYVRRFTRHCTFRRKKHRCRTQLKFATTTTMLKAALALVQSGYTRMWCKACVPAASRLLYMYLLFHNNVTIRHQLCQYQRNKTNIAVPLFCAHKPHLTTSESLFQNIDCESSTRTYQLIVDAATALFLCTTVG